MPRGLYFQHLDMADSKSKFGIKIGLLKKVNILKVSFSI